MKYITSTYTAPIDHISGSASITPKYLAIGTKHIVNIIFTTNSKTPDIRGVILSSMACNS